MSININSAGTQTPGVNPTPVLNPPTSFARTATATTANSIEYSFVEPLVIGSATGYEVVDVDTGLVAFTGIALGTTTVNVTGLSSDTPYLHAIRSYDDTSTSILSNTDGDRTDVAPAGLRFDIGWETGSVDASTTPSPILYWQPTEAFETTNPTPGNYFVIDSAIKNAGNYSLKFDFTGRNNAGNQCGFTNVYQHSSYDGAVFFVDSLGQDLTLDPFYAAVGRTVHNVENTGFSHWLITGVGDELATNDKLTLSLIAPDINAAPNVFNAGDQVHINRLCGVDGTIGGDIDRRSDINATIGHLYGDRTMQYNTSYFRRVYYRPTSSLIYPSLHSKLAYLTNGRHIMTADNNIAGNLDLVVNYGHWEGGLLKIGRENMGELTWDEFNYIEHEYHTESSLDAQDGYVKVWFGVAGSEPLEINPSWDSQVDTTRVIDCPIGDGKGTTSFFGNHQRINDCTGVWHIDDIKYDSAFIGAA